MLKNPQHDRVKPRGGSRAVYTMCKKNIRFGRGWLPLSSERFFWLWSALLDSKEWIITLDLERRWPRDSFCESRRGKRWWRLRRRLETPCRHVALLVQRRGLPGNTCKEGGGRCCGPKLTSCQFSCSNPGWSWRWRRPGWGLISSPPPPTGYAGCKVLKWFKRNVQKIKFSHRKFSLPPLLGSGLYEKSMTSSGPKHLPTIWTRCSSSHILSDIRITQFSVMFYVIDSWLYLPSYIIYILIAKKCRMSKVVTCVG